MVKLEISLKRVQTFIFDVPRLKAMIGANALIGQTMRHELPKLLGDKGKPLQWPESVKLDGTGDPLNPIAPEDRDDPAALYAKGILARDGGHFIAVFEHGQDAEDFLRLAEAQLARLLPGVLFEAKIGDSPRQDNQARETHLLDLPGLQVCQETGREPASDHGGKGHWQARSVTHRLDWGNRFYQGNTRDIIGLLRPELYPGAHHKDPDDLAELAAGDYVALLHADGNGIGQRYKPRRKEGADAFPGDKIAAEAHGEAFFHSMRVAVRRSLVDALRKTFKEPSAKWPYELLMLGGDDLLLVCRASLALEFACKYATELSKYTLADGQPLTIAIGIAIAQKSYPLHRLHELAESLASSAKRLYRSLPDPPEAAMGKPSVIDWQVVTQSWFEGVAEARRHSDGIAYAVDGQTETLLLTGRPYRVLGEMGLEGLVEGAKALDSSSGHDSAARSPLRSLRTACERGRLSGELAFSSLPDAVQAHLGWRHGQEAALWKRLGDDSPPIYLTRALDIIGIREISRLGNKNDDATAQ
jgi:hypothetical protein